MHKTEQKSSLSGKLDAYKRFQTIIHENENSIQKANNVSTLFTSDFLPLLLSTKYAPRSSEIRCNIFALIFAYSLWFPFQQSQPSGKNLLTNFSSKFSSSLTTIFSVLTSGNKTGKLSAWILLLGTLSYMLKPTGAFPPAAWSRIFKTFYCTVQQ